MPPGKGRSYLGIWTTTERARDLIQGDPLTYANFQNGLVATAMAQLDSCEGMKTTNLASLLSAEIFSDLDAAESSLLRELIPRILAGITAGAGG